MTVVDLLFGLRRGGGFRRTFPFAARRLFGLLPGVEAPGSIREGGDDPFQLIAQTLQLFGDEACAGFRFRSCALEVFPE